MAPIKVKGSPEEREQFMAEVYRGFYTHPENAGKDLSVNKANEVFKKKYGSMLRNKKAYQIRAAVKAELKSGGKTKVAATAAARHSQSLVPAGSSRAATLIEGTEDQMKWLVSKVLPQLQQDGLASLRIDHTTSAYAVLARA